MNLSLKSPIIFSLFRFPFQFLRKFCSLKFFTNSSMADQLLDLVESDDITQSLICCVCLDLLHKPIVLSCGHISCFWCVHKSMNGCRESHCPICRHPYYHFPIICEMLHLLILKIYPVAYKKRENQILEEEKKTGYFSPQFDALACGSQGSDKGECLGDVANGGLNVNISNEKIVAEQISEGNSAVVKSASIEDLNSLQNFDSQKTQNHEQVSVADALCPACTQLLFRPVVLHCGHAFCESCIINPDVELLKCQVCQCLQPRGIPNVCLELDQILKENFPEEYSLRKDSVQLKLANFSKRESPTSCSNEGGKNGENLRWSEVSSKVHSGVGCDSCGMYPLIGDRYRCKDCFEKIGFDLCSDCYNTCSKRPGRFNQQHTPKHKFELVRPSMFSNMSLEIVTGMLEDGFTTFFIANDDGSESSEDVGAVLELLVDARGSDETFSDDMDPIVSTNEEIVESDSQPTA